MLIFLSAFCVRILSLPQLIKHAPLCRGCLFVTYEVVALDKAVTIDTSAILQEKNKSYVYLRATPSDEKDSLTAGNKCHSFKLHGQSGMLYIYICIYK